MSERTMQCPICHKGFADTNAIRQHLRMKHGGDGKAQFPREDDEPSLAEQFIDDEINEACGIAPKDACGDAIRTMRKG